MAKHNDIDPTYEGMSKTEKGPAYYPGEVMHGALGDCKDAMAYPGSGTQNLSPPNAKSMGGAMVGAGLPPANSIKLGIDPPGRNASPPGPVSVDPMMYAGKCMLPPGPYIEEHTVGNPGELPPGVPVGTSPSKTKLRGGGGPQGGGGQLPPGVGV